MTRRALGLISPFLAAALAVSVAFAAVGDHISAQDFDLHSSNYTPKGITWDGTHFYVMDDGNNRFVRYTSSGTYTQSMNTHGGRQALGITWDGTYLRVLDSSTSQEVAAYTTSGTHASAQDFDLAAANSDAQGITWDGNYFRVVDDDRVYAYAATGTLVNAQQFNLADANDDSTGITWDGTYFRVVDDADDKVYTYTASGTHTSTQDFDLAAANDYPTGITWDGAYLRVVDWGLGGASDDEKIYTYEGPPTGPVTNYGLPDDTEYEGAVSTAVVAYDDWKCIRSQAGETIRINNAEVTVHGFCARETPDADIAVEIHLSPTAEYADLKRFADVTGMWSFIEVGIAASLRQSIYEDTATTDTGAIAFTEETGLGLEASDRLGFATMAKAVEDTDCTETSDGAGFICTPVNLENLLVSDEAVLLFSLTDENKLDSADTPTAPDSLTVSRSADYTTATVEWELYDAVTVYEIQRLTAVQVDVADASRIEYGDPVTFTVAGTQAGIDEYADSTVEAHRTYQYRVRARGADTWSEWSVYVFSGARPQVDLAAPGNLELDRDADSVTVSWTAPAGDLDGYTLQRQELVVVGGSTLFANVVTLGSATSTPPNATSTPPNATSTPPSATSTPPSATSTPHWLPDTSTMYTDRSIIPSQTYEYRVAAVKDDQIGVYSDWFRVGPPNTSLGQAPPNFRFLSTGQRILDDRREFWMGWDDVPGADDYEIQVVVYDVATGGQSMDGYVVTDPTYFQTAYGRVGLRVRGRKLDDAICGSNSDDRCLTEWSGWYEVRFTPTIIIDTPDMADDTADASIMALRQDVEEIIKAVMEPAGATVDGARVVQFVVLLSAVLVAGLSVALSWRRGMAPLGVGMGAAILILILFTGYRLLGTPLAWPVAAQSLVAVAGLFALVRQTGVFR